MGFFSKTLDKLKGALRKTAAVLNTDVRTLFVPGRQINDEFLTEMEERLGILIEDEDVEAEDLMSFGRLLSLAERLSLQ